MAFEQVGVQAVVKGFQSYTDRIGTMEKVTGKFGHLMGTVLKAGALAGGAAIVAGFTKGTLSAISFEKQMAEVHTLLGQDFPKASFEALNKDILALSSEMGIATEEIVPALYQAISAGIPPENVIDFLRTGAKASIGGVTDLETAVDGLTTITNAWGLESSEAGRIADVMFTGVKLGKTTMAELSASMFQAAPLASALGISVGEVVAATATLTKSGVPTAQAMTQMRQTMVALSKPTKEMAELLEQTGFASGEALIEAKGFTGAINVLTEAAGGNKEVMAKAFGSVEALGFVLGVSGDNAAGAAADFAQVTDSAGAADEAFETMNKTTARQFQILKNKLMVTLTKLGLKVLPVLMKAMAKVTMFIKGFIAGFEEADVTSKGFFGIAEKVGKTVRELTDRLIAIGKVINSIVLPPLKLLVSALSKLIGFLAENKDILAAVAIAIGVVLIPSLIAWALHTAALVALHTALAVATVLAYAPIIALVAGIALLVFGVIQLIKHWDEIMAFIKQKVIPMFENLWEKIDEFLGNLPLIGAAWEAVKQVVKDKIEAVVRIVQRVIDIGKEVISFFQNVFKGDWDAAWTDLKQIAMGVLNLFLDFLELTFFGTIKSILKSIVPWDWVKEKVNEFKNKVTEAFTDTKTAIGDVIKSIPGFLREHWKEIVTGALSILFPPAGGLFALVTNAGGVRDKVVGAFAAIPGLLLGLAQSFYDATLSLGGTLMDGLVDGIGAVGGIAQDIAQAVGNAIKSFINTEIIDKINRALEFKINMPSPIPDVNLNPPDIPRLHTGAFNIPRDMVARLQAGEMVLPRLQAEAVRDTVLAPQPAATPGLDRLAQALEGRGGGDLIANVTSPSQEQIAEEVAGALRGLAFELGRASA